MATGIMGREKPNLTNFWQVSDAVSHSIVRSKARKLLWVWITAVS